MLIFRKKILHNIMIPKQVLSGRMLLIKWKITSLGKRVCNNVWPQWSRETIHFMQKEIVYAINYSQKAVHKFNFVSPFLHVIYERILHYIMSVICAVVWFEVISADKVTSALIVNISGHSVKCPWACLSGLCTQWVYRRWVPDGKELPGHPGGGSQVAQQRLWDFTVDTVYINANFYHPKNSSCMPCMPMFNSHYSISSIQQW